MDIQEIRRQYPQYANKSDEELARALHKKYYADRLSYDDFSARIGLVNNSSAPAPAQPGQTGQPGVGAQVTNQMTQTPPEGQMTIGRAIDNTIDSLANPNWQQEIDNTVGAAETVMNMGSGMLAQPIAGLWGLLKAGAGSIGIGDTSWEDAGDVVRETQDMLTYSPHTEQGRKTLRAVGDLVAPVAETVEGFKTGIGDKAYNATGSPALSAMAYTAPDAVLSLIGLRPISRLGMRRGRGANRTVQNRPTERAVDDFIMETPVEAQAIKDAARRGFRELEDASVKIRQSSAGKLQNKLRSVIERHYNKDVARQPIAAVENIIDRLDDYPSLSALDDAYTDITALATANPDKLSGAIASQARSAILDFMDNATKRDFSIPFQKISKQGRGATDIVKTYRASQKLWRRAKRLEAVEDAFEYARVKSLSGRRSFHDALVERVENMRLNKDSKLFTAEERLAMEELLEARTADKMANLIGKLEFSNNKSTTIITSALGGGAAAGGAVAGAAGAATGGVGTLGVLWGLHKATGWARKNLTSTRFKAFEQGIATAGSEGRKIARVYMETVPKAKRDPSVLAKMLADPKVNINFKAHDKFMREAIDMARGYRTMARAELTAAGLGTEFSAYASSEDNDE